MEPILLLTIVSVIGSFIILTSIINGIITVPHNTIAIIERFGKYKKTLTSGINFLYPFDKIKQINWNYYEAEHHTNNPIIKKNVATYTFIPSHIITIDIPPVMCRSKDNLEISIDSSIRYQITNPMLAVYECSEPLGYIQDVVVETIRNICSNVDAASIQNNYGLVFNSVLETVNNKINNYGIRCTLFTIQETSMSEKIKKCKEDNYARIKEAEMINFIQEQEHQMKIQRLNNELLEQELENKKVTETLLKELERKHLISETEQKIWMEKVENRNRRLKQLNELGYTNDQITKMLSDEMWSDAFRDTKITSVGYLPSLSQMNNMY